MTSVQSRNWAITVPAASSASPGGEISFNGLDAKGEIDEQGYLATGAGAGCCGCGAGGGARRDRLRGGEDQRARDQGEVAAGEPAGSGVGAGEPAQARDDPGDAAG